MRMVLGGRQGDLEGRALAGIFRRHDSREGTSIGPSKHKAIDRRLWQP